MTTEEVLLPSDKFKVCLNLYDACVDEMWPKAANKDTLKTGTCRTNIFYRCINDIKNNIKLEDKNYITTNNLGNIKDKNKTKYINSFNAIVLKN